MIQIRMCANETLLSQARVALWRRQRCEARGATRIAQASWYTGICTAEQAIELFNEGYCGQYLNVKEHIKPVFDVKSEVDIASMIEASVSSSVEAIGKRFNEKCQQEQPGPNLLNVNETLLMEDACTNALQENLENGWRIIAVCPQPQRRPDYVLGRKKGL
jgi:hypothetical protein